MKISAVIPAYNAEPWLREAIVSIKRQTRPVQEIIVVDDGSTDGTAAIARSEAVDVVSLRTNAGEGAARNAGLERATGEAIAWLDADDFWAPHHVHVLADLLARHREASAACAALQQFGLQTFRCGGVAPADRPGNLFWHAVGDWVHPLTGAMLRRQAILDVGGFATEPRTSVDFDLWLRLTREHLVIGTREVTAFWRWHPDQQSQHPGRQLVALYTFQRRYHDRLLPHHPPEDAERFREIMRRRWTSDLDEAFRNGDRKVCREIFDAHPLIVELDPAVVDRYREALLA